MLQVPFSMIALIDHIRQKDLPADLKCRQVRDLYRELTVVPDYDTIAVVQPVSRRASWHSHNPALLAGFPDLRWTEFLSLGCCQHFASLGVAGRAHGRVYNK